jgi:hypothetical protein
MRNIVYVSFILLLAGCGFIPQRGSDVWLQEYAEVTNQMVSEYEVVFVRSVVTHPSFATGRLSDLETIYYFVIEDGSVLQVRLGEEGLIEERLFSEGQDIGIFISSADETLSYVQCSPNDVIELISREYNFISGENERYVEISLKTSTYIQQNFGVPAIWEFEGPIPTSEENEHQVVRFIVDPHTCRLLKRIDDINAPLGG